MGLLHQDVTLLNFDHLYEHQHRLIGRADEMIELSSIPSTNLFCTHEALAEIRRKLSSRRANGITYIGSGNYHYVTFALLSEIDHPFSLVLFDNHTDAKRSDQLPGLLTCGSWAAEAISRLPRLQQVVWVGVHADALPYHSGFGSKLAFVPDLESAPPLLNQLVTDDIYISIDKDVLDEADAITNWDQGTMRLRQLITAIHSLVVSKNVIGMDVCGELRVPPSDIWKYSEQIRLNEMANLAILEAVI